MLWKSSGRWIAPGLCLFAGFLVGSLRPVVVADPTPAIKTAAPPFPMSERIGANLYLQTSAEYRACCLQIYHLATERLETILRSTKPERPAVVMDLDETVFDNSAFQTYLYANNYEYTDALWDIYEEKYPHDVTLVPGAKEFIAKAESLGVTVYFISNRSERFFPSTEKAIAHVGINTGHLADRIGLKALGANNDKTSRRAAAAAKFNVVLTFGDNLRDFSEEFLAKKLPKDAPDAEFDQAIADRMRQADQQSCRWGVDWFVLPNPVYGEWDKLLGANPRKRMRPTTMPKP